MNIKLNQKRTCINCKALHQLQYIAECELGYNFNKQFAPIEPCPKPKTYSDLIECRKWYRNKNIILC